MGGMQKVFVNSLPKAGTNLVAKALLLMGFNERFNLGAQFVLGKRMRSRLRRFLCGPIRQGYLVGIDTPVEVSRSLVDRALDKTDPGCFMTAHVGYTNDILHTLSEKDFVTVLVLRDPRAVLSSFVHYVTKNKAHVHHPFFQSLEPEDRYRIALYGGTYGGYSLQPLMLRCLSVTPWLESESTLVLRFEDLVGSKGGGTDESQLEVLSKLSRLVGSDDSVLPVVAENLFGEGRHTFRKGQIDAWREDVPDAMLNELNACLDYVLEKWGYPVV